MSFKETKFYSILFNKCPRCHEGAYYKFDNPFKAFLKKDVMHPKCSVCEQSFEPETGFYYGALFVSYALSVAVFVAMWIGILVLAPNSFSVLETILIIIGGLILFSPLSLYYSKLIWLNLFVKYKSSKS